MCAGERLPPSSRRSAPPRTCSATAARATGRPASRCTRAPSAGRSAARSSCRRARSAAASAARCRAGRASTANRSGSISVGLPCRLRRTSHQPSPTIATAPTAMSDADGLAALLPDEDAEHDAAHADHRQDRADDVERRAARCRGRRGRARCPTARCDDDRLEEEGDAPRQVGGDEAADQRPDGGGDRGRRPDQRVRPAAAPRPRSCRGSATASPAAAARRRGRRGSPSRRRSSSGSGRTPSTARRRHSRAGRARRPACGRTGRRSCCR